MSRNFIPFCAPLATILCLAAGGLLAQPTPAPRTGVLAQMTASTSAHHFRSVRELLEDSALTYDNTQVHSFLHAREHLYEVLPQATAGDLRTTGGLNLKVMAQGGMTSLAAFGDIGAGQPASAAFVRAFDRAGSYLLPAGSYLIDEAMRLRSGTSLHFAAGARIEMAVGAVDNLIRNHNATAPLEPAVAVDTSVTYASHDVGDEVRIGDHRYILVAQSSTHTDLVNAAGAKFIPALDTDISITGASFSAVLDQNGPQTRDAAQIERWRWHGILLESVQHVHISGFTIKDTTRYGINCQGGCFDVRIANMNFEQRGYDHGRGIKNQDCINIRQGSSRVYVGYIYGRCGDDVVAITGLQPSYSQGDTYVPGRRPNNINLNRAYRSREISHVTVEHLFADAAGSHHKVRLLGSDDVEVHHIFITNIHDSTTARDIDGNDLGRTTGAAAAILIGSPVYGRDPHTDSTLMHNIFISDVSTLTRSAVRFQWSAQDVYMSDITLQWDATTSDTEGRGQEAYLVRYADTNTFPVTESFRPVYRNHVLDGGAMLHDGRVPEPTDLTELGVGVFFDQDMDIYDSVFSNVVIKEARNIAYIGADVNFHNVLFSDWTVFRLGQMAFRVIDAPSARDLVWSAKDIVAMDRDRIGAGLGNVGQFYSSRNNMRLMGSMPNVRQDEPPPVPVDGSRVRFEAGAGKFSRATNAIGENNQWVSQ
jgi:hypothetical protein